jgi:hypothetical protein
MAQKDVSVTLNANGGITVVRWAVKVDLRASNPSPDFIQWNGTGCRIMILPDHPDHFSQILPPEGAPVVIGTFANNAPAGTYKYRIIVVGDDRPIDDEVKQKLRSIDLRYPADALVAEVHIIDPDYKVDR